MGHVVTAVNYDVKIFGKICENISSLTSNDLGFAKKVEFKKVAGDDLCFISGCKNPKAVSRIYTCIIVGDALTEDEVKNRVPPYVFKTEDSLLL